MRVSVVALGKIGLPLAVQFAAKGHQVVGVDINPKTVEQVNAGQEPFPGSVGVCLSLGSMGCRVHNPSSRLLDRDL